MIQIPEFIDSNRLASRLPPPVRRRLEAWVDNLNTILSVQNPIVMGRMAPSAVRGLFLREGKSGEPTSLRARHAVHLDFEYPRQSPELAALYEKAKNLQWNASRDLDWQTSVDPLDPNVKLLSEDFIGWDNLAAHGIRFNDVEKRDMLRKVASWMLSQFLHGEQGALLAAAQVTEAVPDLDARLYGATQVMDEARHVEVFHRYLEEKLELRYEINDNLFTIIDNLMTDGRWDMKFLGMQILVEGLALGAFGTLLRMTGEPLLKNLLRRVIHDEARHVRYGLVSLSRLYNHELSDRERIEREDWAFEIVLLMRNRFLAHELYEESFEHGMTRRQWNDVMSRAPGMQVFRQVMFRRLVPNLKAIGLLTPRVMPRYAAVGLDRYFDERSTDQLEDGDLMAA